MSAGRGVAGAGPVALVVALVAAAGIGFGSWPDPALAGEARAVVASAPEVLDDGGLSEAELRQRERAAEQGDGKAKFTFARMLERGEGVRPDLIKARQFYCKAAEAGSGEAAFRLSRMFLMGWGVPLDILTSMAWTRRAAALGHDEAQRAARFLPTTGPQAKPSCSPRQPGSLFSAGLLRSLHPGLPPRETPPGMRGGVPLQAPAALTAAVRQMAPRYGLDPELVLAVIAVESDFRPDLVSKRNAQGLMQLIPDTARRFGITDPFDPEDNLRGGMSYLRWLLAYFEGNVRLALAGYNAGEGAVIKYGGIPPYAETTNYVIKVQQRYPQSWHPFAADVTTPASQRRRLARGE